MSKFWEEQREKYGNGRAIYDAVENAIAGVNFRRHANTMFYEGTILTRLTGDGHDCDNLSLAEVFDARGFKSALTTELIEARVTGWNYVFNAPHLGERKI